MKLVVGLGNPGPRYATTRHNVGFRVVERWAARRGVELAAERFGGRFGRGRLAAAGGSLEVGALLPLTYMNRSGSAVAEAVHELLLEDVASDLLVVFDDVDLPFGRLRLRPAGSAGGHRGLTDVIRALGSSDLPRLRFGVGRPEGSTDAAETASEGAFDTAPETADWVLQPFDGSEESRLPELLDRAADAVETVLLEGIVPAMNRFNRVAASEAPDPLQ